MLLTTNTSDIKKRIWYAPDFLALDGYMSQAGEMFMQVHNMNTTSNMTLTVPRVYGHSAYFTNHLSQPISTPPTPLAPAGGLASGCSFQGGPDCGQIYVDAGGKSKWVDVGAFVDVYNHGSWNFKTVGNYALQIGIGSAAAPTPIGPAFVSNGDGVQLLFDWSTRATKRVRTEASDFWELKASLDQQSAAAGFIPGKIKANPWCAMICTYHLLRFVRQHTPLAALTPPDPCPLCFGIVRLSANATAVCMCVGMGLRSTERFGRPARPAAAASPRPPALSAPPAPPLH